MARGEALDFPQNCMVSVVRIPGGRKRPVVWGIMLEYQDGEVYMSRQIFPTEAEARVEAERWAVEHMEPSAGMLRQ